MEKFQYWKNSNFGKVPIMEKFQCWKNAIIGNNIILQ